MFERFKNWWYVGLLDVKNKEIDRLTSRLTATNAAYDELLKKYKGSGSVSIDFNKIKVFSIERSGGKTVIGHIFKSEDSKQEIKSWVLSITVEEHEQLVNEFNNFLGKNVV